MKVPNYSQITNDSLSQSQNEKNLLVSSLMNILPLLNNPLMLMTSAMNNNLTFQDNMNAEHQVISGIKSGVDFNVNLQKMKTRPTHMVCGYASGETITGQCIKTYKSLTELVCNITFSSGNTNGVSVDLLFF